MGKLIIGNDRNYRPAIGLNQSLISAYSKGLKSYREYLGIGLTEEALELHRNKAAFRKGSALDCILTEGEDVFRKRFFKIPKFNETSQDIILIRAWVKAGNSEWDPEAMELMSRTLEYEKAGEKVKGLWLANKWESNIDPSKLKTEKGRESAKAKAIDDTKSRIATRIAKFNTDFNRKFVFNYLTQYSSRTYITTEEYNEVILAAKKLKENEQTSKIITAGDNEILYTQLDLYEWIEIPELNGVELEGVDHYKVVDCKSFIKFKGILDFVKVNTENKTIQPIDLKSTSKHAYEYFIDSVASYGYIVQDSLYSELISIWAQREYPDYEVLPFEFVISSLSEADEPPMIFELEDEHRKIGKFGGVIGYELEGRSKRVEFKGWYNLARNLTLQEATGQLYMTPEQKYRFDNNLPQKPNFRVIWANDMEDKTKGEDDDKIWSDLGLDVYCDPSDVLIAGS